MQRHWAWVCLGLLCSLMACSDDKKGESEPKAPVDTLLLEVTTFEGALAAAPAAEERGNAAITLWEKAMLDPVAAEHLGGRDLSQAQVGQEATFSFDIDRDGAADEVYVFTSSLDQVDYLIWRQASDCLLAWRDQGSLWMVRDTCNGSPQGSIVCQDASCARCDDSGCQSCQVSATEVRCALPAQEEADMGEVGGEDMSQEDIFVPDRPGECNLECVSQRGAFCCKECGGCQGEIHCVPECRTGFSWDCELGCCFNYDTFACDCAEGSTWSPRNYCCVDDAEGACVSAP